MTPGRSVMALPHAFCTHSSHCGPRSARGTVALLDYGAASGVTPRRRSHRAIVAAQRSTHSGRNAQLQRALPPAIAVDGRRVRLWLCSPWTGVSATTLSALVGEAETSTFGLALATGCDHHRAASLSSF